MPVASVMLAPQQPHLSNPVNKVGELAILGGMTAGARAALWVCTASNSDFSMIGSTAMRTHSLSGLNF
ncbi:MAG: hypothetical protein LZF61_09165 [Nitrosomonas sp.]|nr:MAG: hypothetical protein LZF61_09165 [Nitrosomonas sp.]